jgi:Fur family transcriptional regulator, stress-responsive regulator
MLVGLSLELEEVKNEREFIFVAATVAGGFRPRRAGRGAEGRRRRGKGTSISELAERLRDRGWRLTAQRRVVAEVLVGEHVHLTAEAVHQAAQAVLPEISLATVYNTLNELVGMGEVLEISSGDGPKRYDPNTTIPHQHLRCVRCGALRDVAPTGDDHLALPPEQRHGFEVVGVDIVFRGLCPDCAGAVTDPRSH